MLSLIKTTTSVFAYLKRRYRRIYVSYRFFSLLDDIELALNDLHGSIDALFARVDELEALDKQNRVLLKAEHFLKAEQAGQIDRLRAALLSAAKRMKNCRSAIESNQVVDKDVVGSLAWGIREIDDLLTREQAHGH